MSSFSSNRRSSNGRRGVAALTLLALALTACGPRIPKTPMTRSFLPRFDAASLEGVKPAQDEGAGPAMLTDVPARMTACRWLRQIPASSNPSANFRLVEAIEANADGRPMAVDPEGAAACKTLYSNKAKDLSQDEAEALWAKCSAFEPVADHTIDLDNLYGRVDIGASPLYQYAIAIQNLPTTDQFIQLAGIELKNENVTGKDWVDSLLADSSLFWKWVLYPVLLPLKAFDRVFGIEKLKVRIVMSLLEAKIIDPEKLRNSTIRKKKIEAALPGMFTRGEENSKLNGSIPYTLFKFGVPDIERLRPSGVSDPERIAKAHKLNEIVANFKEPKALFRPGGWHAFREDMRTGMSVAIRSYNSNDPIEQACATVLFHRAFAQMMNVMGYERLAIERSPSDPSHSYLPEMGDLVGQYTKLEPVDPKRPEGPQENKPHANFRICNTPGMFGRDGRLRMLTTDELADYSPGKHPETWLDLSAEPLQFSDCRLRDAQPYGLTSQVPDRNEFRLNEKAAAGELVEFTAAATYFAMGFSPAAPWWSESPLPLSKFDSFDQIKTTGGILPWKAHALALAFMNIGVSNLMQKYIVYFDNQGRELPDSKGAFGIRIADQAHAAGSGGVITSKARTAALLTEVVYKLDLSFAKLAAWYDRLRGPNDAKDPLIQGMFSSVDTLELLTDPSDGGLRSMLGDLQFASALMLASYGVKLPDGTTTCADSLTRNLNTGVETPEGRCSPEDHALWKSALRLAAQKYGSAVIQEMAK